VTTAPQFRTAAETSGAHGGIPQRPPGPAGRRLYATLARWDTPARVEGSDSGQVWYARNSVDLAALPPVVLLAGGQWVGSTARLIDTGHGLDAVLHLDHSADSDAILGILADWGRVPLLPRYEGHLVARVAEAGTAGLEYIGGRLTEIAIVPAASFDAAWAYAPGDGPEYWS
jgi:hypothetical protein